MSKIRSVILSFEPPVGEDIVNYKLYFATAPEAVTYDSPFVDLGLTPSYDLAALPGAAGTDQTFNLGVAAVDDVGNESEMSLATDVKLDFAAPGAPGPIQITRS